MAMSPEKLARLASERVQGSMHNAVSVRSGFGLGFAGNFAFIFLLMISLQLLGAVHPAGPVVLIAATFAAFWWSRRAGKYREAILGRIDDEVVLIETDLFRRKPIRDEFQRYATGTPVRFSRSTNWWRASKIVAGDDEWFVDPKYNSVAERWY